MYKLYLGNLPFEINNEMMDKLFIDHGIKATNLDIRRGVDFAQLPNQKQIEQAVDILHGRDLLGNAIIAKKCYYVDGRSTKILLRQLPANVDWAEIEKFAADHGEVVNCNRSGTAEAPTAIITYKTPEQATEAVSKLDKKEINGAAIKATIFVDRARNPRRGIGGGGQQNRMGVYPTAMGGDYMNRQSNPLASAGLPLRMVVGARYVGAIIGQGGANIREITRESKARCVVDVNRGLRDQAGNVEKVINIYGPPESCSKACMRILEVVQREAAKDPANQGKTIEPELKVRAHNNLVGRLIGKGGSTIKKIMEETGCTIFVSNSGSTCVVSDSRQHRVTPTSSGRSSMAGVSTSSMMMNTTLKMMMQPEATIFSGAPFYYNSISELTAFNMERTITIRGDLEHVAQAESKISAKLRQCWENDAANAPSAMYPGMHPFVPVPQVGAQVDPYCYSLAGGVPAAFVPPIPQVAQMAGRSAAPMHPGVAPPPPPPQAGASYSPSGAAIGGGTPVCYTEVVHIWVPNNIVGALIGTKGVHIRNIMRLTGAHIRIESTKNEASASADPQQQQQPEKPAEDAAAAQEQTPPPQQQQQQVNQQSSGSDPRQMDTERRVTITGSDQQQYKAQFWIFQRLCEHGHHFFDEVRLCTEVQVPSKLVGRIIGKGGQNVRELQRMTGAQVKIPEDAATQAEDEDTFVRITGNFNASQAVQARIRQLVHQYHSQQQQQPALPPRSMSGDRQQRANNNSRGVNHHSESHE